MSWIPATKGEWPLSVRSRDLRQSVRNDDDATSAVIGNCRRARLGPTLNSLAPARGGDAPGLGPGAYAARAPYRAKASKRSSLLVHPDHEMTLEHLVSRDAQFLRGV